jgi:hypothetical protein
VAFFTEVTQATVRSITAVLASIAGAR